MKVKVLFAGTVVALSLVGVTGAYAQIVYPGSPYPYPGALYQVPPAVVAPAPSIVVAPSPYGGAYIYGGPVVVNPYTGRWCTFEPNGWHWCWTP